MAGRESAGMIDCKEFESLLEVAKRNNVKRFNLGTLMVEFSDTNFESPIIQKPHEGIRQEGLPTEDDLLYWSSDSLLEEKKNE